MTFKRYSFCMQKGVKFFWIFFQSNFSPKLKKEPIYCQNKNYTVLLFKIWLNTPINSLSDSYYFGLKLWLDKQILTCIIEILTLRLASSEVDRLLCKLFPAGTWVQSQQMPRIKKLINKIYIEPEFDFFPSFPISSFHLYLHLLSWARP